MNSEKLNVYVKRPLPENGCGICSYPDYPQKNDNNNNNNKPGRKLSTTYLRRKLTVLDVGQCLFPQTGSSLKRRPIKQCRKTETVRAFFSLILSYCTAWQ